MRKVFADTFYWIATVRPNDPDEMAARTARDAIGPCVVATADEVPAEFVAAFSRGGSPLRAQGGPSGKKNPSAIGRRGPCAVARFAPTAHVRGGGGVMGRSIDRITLNGFKSIERLEDFALDKLNVLIGANGAGKSNFVDYFRMLRSFADENFQQFVSASGGGDGFLFLGPKVTPEITSKIAFGRNSYGFA